MNILEPLETGRETQNVNLNAAKTRYKDYNLFIMKLAPLCPKPNFGPSGCKINKRPDYLLRLCVNPARKAFTILLVSSCLATSLAILSAAP